MAWMRQKAGTESGKDGREARPKPTAAEAGSLPSAPSGTAGIGASVTLEGELSGHEDLVIDGTVKGRITLNDHVLTIGPNGRITAEIHAKSVKVGGHVAGDITADDRVEIAATGVVRGDIRAPRVAIADGAKFKGSIDMERGAGAARNSATTPSRELPRTARGA